jgi:hypothetical protein
MGEADRMVSGSIRLPPAVARRSYIGISLIIALMAIVGFWPTYLGPLLVGAVESPLVIHFHFTIYSGWVALFVAQSAFASTGRLALHRKLGKIGIYYGFALVPVGILTAFVIFAGRVEAGLLEEAQRRLLAPLTDMVLFPIFFGAAVGYRRKPEIHKRFMVVATTTLLVAAVARMTFLGTPVPPIVFLLVWFLPILLGMAHDFMTRRLIHPVYVIGLVCLYLLSLRRHAVDTETWLNLSAWLVTLVS